MTSRPSTRSNSSTRSWADSAAVYDLEIGGFYGLLHLLQQLAAVSVAQKLHSDPQRVHKQTGSQAKIQSAGGHNASQSATTTDHDEIKHCTECNSAKFAGFDKENLAFLHQCRRAVVTRPPVSTW